MAATATAPPPLSPTGGGGGDQDGSNISSPLSEVDDKDANDEEIEHMQLDRDGRDNSSPSGDEQPDGDNHEGSDSDSVLSDAQSDVNSEANDTEAETERLYDTPRNQRKRDVVVDQFNQGQVFESTPSKLRRMTMVKKEIPDDESGPDENDSAASNSDDDEEESPTKRAAARGSDGEDSKRASPERKRKRPVATEQSDSDQPLRKRMSSAVVADGDADDDSAANDDAASTALPDSGRATADDREESPSKHNDSADEEQPERETRSTRKITRNGSKRKGALPSDGDEVDTDGQDATRNGATEDDGEQQDEDMDADAEEEAEAAARNLEELERKQSAFRDWSQIEEMFGIFRDRLYKDRIKHLEHEEQTLLAADPTHTEFLNMKQCIDDQYNQKLRDIDTEFNFRLRANERRAVAQRAQIWSQYFQGIREKRETALETLNKEWYDVQNARRGAHSLPDYGLLYPKDAAQRIRNAVAYNTEVSTLAGLARYEGFPAGPELKGASRKELEDDLSIMERARPGRSKAAAPVREGIQTADFHRLGPAGEQFLKDTPWANPNHSSHKSFQPSPPAAGSGRAGLPGERKPLPDSSASSHKPSGMSSRLSESPELTRSMVPNSHAMKRVGSMANVGRGSKTAAA